MVPASRREHTAIFEPFFSTKDAKGTGLGLWVSQGIVQKNRGKIRVRSKMAELLHGTCFIVFLPFSAAEQSLVKQKLPSPSKRWGCDGQERDWFRGWFCRSVSPDLKPQLDNASGLCSFRHVDMPEVTWVY